MLRFGILMMCVLLMAMLGVSVVSAQTGGAMLYANGTVRVNGHDSGDATSIFSGDRIDVSASSAGSINRNGSSIVVSPNSAIQYDPAAIQVLQGSARVSTSKGMSVKIGDVLVSPESAAAKFDVTKAGDKVVVVSREGALSVKDGSETRVVQPGSSTELALAAGAAPTEQANATQPNFLPQDRLAEHPFYGVVNGVETTPATLPICADITTCIRPGVSNIRPCCCPPRVMCH